MSDETEVLLSITQVWTVADCWNRYVEQTKNMDNLEGLIDDLEAARLNILAEHEAQFANPPSAT